MSMQLNKERIHHRNDGLGDMMVHDSSRKKKEKNEQKEIEKYSLNVFRDSLEFGKQFPINHIYLPKY